MIIHKFMLIMSNHVYNYRRIYVYWDSSPSIHSQGSRVIALRLTPFVGKINSYPLLSTKYHSYPLLSTLFHSYPLLSHSYPLLSTLIQLLSTLIQLLSNSYPTLIHSYSLLILRVMFFTLIHSYPLLSTLNKYGRLRINGVYLDLKWCINGKDCGSKWISARKIGVLGLTSS